MNTVVRKLVQEEKFETYVNESDSPRGSVESKDQEIEMVDNRWTVKRVEPQSKTINAMNDSPIRKDKDLDRTQPMNAI